MISLFFEAMLWYDILFFPYINDVIFFVLVIDDVWCKRDLGTTANRVLAKLGLGIGIGSQEV